MPSDQFNRYHYIQTYGLTPQFISTITKHLTEHPNAQSIPIIGVGIAEQEIPTPEAFQILRSYLVENNASTQLLQIFDDPENPSTYKIQIILEFLRRGKEDLALANTAKENVTQSYRSRLDREIAAAQASKNSSLEQALKEQRKQFREHNQRVNSLAVATYGQTQAEQLAQNRLIEKVLPDEEFTEPATKEEIRQALPQVILAVMSVTQAITPDPDASAEANKAIRVKQALRDISQDNPSLQTFELYNAEEDQLSALIQLADKTQKTLQKAHPEVKLADYEKSQRIVFQQTRNLTTQNRHHTEQALIRQFVDQGKLTQAQAVKLATGIFNESVVAAYKSNGVLSGEEIVKRAAGKIDTTISPEIAINLTQEYLPDIQNHHQLQVLEARTKGDRQFYRFRPNWLLPQEVRLAKRLGVDPSSITNNYTSSARKLLEGQNLPFRTPRELYGSLSQMVASQLSSATPNLELVGQLKTLQNHFADKIKIGNSGIIRRAQAGSIRIRHAVRSSFNRFQSLKHQAWSSWYGFTETLPWNRARKWIFNTQNKIYDSGWGWVFSPVQKTSEAWHNLKAKQTKKAIKKRKGTKSRWGKAALTALLLFDEGDYTLAGTAKATGKYLISKAYHTAKKAVGKVVWKGVKKVAAWAGKKLIAWGFEAAVTAIAGATTGIGAALGVVFIVVEAAVIVVEVAKLIIKHRKKIGEFIKNAFNFMRGVAYAIWSWLKALLAAIKGILTSVASAGVGFIIGNMILPGVGGLIGAGVGLVVANWGAVSAWLASTVGVIGGFFSSIAAGMMATLANAGALVVGTLTAVGVTTATYYAYIITAAITPSTYGIGPYEGPIYDGCVQALPVTSGPVIQGPHAPYSHTILEAIDIVVPNGTPVYSIRDNGRVSFTGFLGAYGNTIMIFYQIEDGKSFTTLYAHLASIIVNRNDEVSAGTQIGTADSTSSKPAYRNPHLHYEYIGIRYGYCPVPGVDPAVVEGCYGNCGFVGAE